MADEAEKNRADSNSGNELHGPGLQRRLVRLEEERTYQQQFRDTVLSRLQQLEDELAKAIERFSVQLKASTDEFNAQIREVVRESRIPRWQVWTIAGVLTMATLGGSAVVVRTLATSATRDDIVEVEKSWRQELRNHEREALKSRHEVENRFVQVNADILTKIAELKTMINVLEQKQRR
jgi:hypothetical protein